MDYENLALEVLNNNIDLVISICDDNKVDYYNLYLILFALCNDKTGVGNEYINSMLDIFTKKDIVFIRSYIYDLDNLFKTERLYSPEALAEACRFNNIKLVKHFFEQLEIPKQDIRNAFCHACQGGLLELVEFLYEKIKDDNFATYEQYPLHLSIDSSRYEITKFLLLNGLDEDFKHNEITSLHVACSNQEKLKIVKLLKLHNKKDQFGFTPLHRAVISQQVFVVQLLCENINDVNLIDKEGKTPLFYACATKNNTIMKILLMNKAKL